MFKMLHIGAKMFFGIADKLNNRVLYPAKVTEVSQNICACTAEFEEVNDDGFCIENGQEMPIYYEFKHLKSKLKIRAPDKYKELLKIKKIEANPVFSVVKGPIENWEKV